MQLSMRALLLAGVSAFLAAAAPVADKPPAARVDADFDTYFGKKVLDPYRWMEAGGEELTAWAKAQNAYARATIAAIPGRDRLLAHMNEVSRAQTVASGVVKVGNRLFFKRRDAGVDLARLYVRDLDGGAERVLVDPNKATQDGHHISVDQFQPSQDGRYVAVGISPAGSEEDVLRVVDAETGKLLEDSIDRARFANPSWLPDNRSFFYNRLRPSGKHEPAADRFKFNKVYIHHLGSDPDKDLPVFGAAIGDVTSVGPNDLVFVSAIPGTRYALAWQSDGVSPESAYYLSKLPATGDTGFAWKQIISRDDNIVDVTATRDTLYLRSHDGAPRYKILSVPLEHPEIASAKTVVPQGDAVITAFAAAADGLYVATRQVTVSGLLHVGGDGKAAAVKLPLSGSIDTDLTADPRVPGAVVGVQTWVTPPTWFSTGSGDDATPADLKLAPGNASVDDYVITETTVQAKDGKTKLPLSIIEKKGTPHDHNQPVLVEGYGAYGISEEPFPAFTTVVRGWVDAGGVMAVAHVRGGGELGEDWHLAGKKATKQNTIHDFVDCAWAMTGKLGYAAQGNVAGMGTSAGGITIGGAITQFPSQFRAALIKVGVSNPLRFETTEGGPANVGEFGTVANQADFTNLLAMDAYQHVKPGIPYPAVLLTAGAQDHRVPLWQSAKMAARLEVAGKNKGPVLLRVDYDGGHGTIGAGAGQANAEWADCFAFLFWQLGVKGFQPGG
jgi:prolyl oligopeptidase